MNQTSYTHNTAKTQRRVAVIGDSIAAGYGLSPTHAWPNLLHSHLVKTWPAYDWALNNDSIPGDTTPDAYARFDAILMQRPHLVLIALGINDCRHAYSPVVSQRIARFRHNEQTWWGKNPLLRRIGNRLNPPEGATATQTAASQVPINDFLAILSWMVRQVQAVGAYPALLTMSPLAPQLADHPDFAACSRYNSAIRDIARETEAALVEVSFKMPDNAWLQDGVHLTTVGQAELARRVFLNFHRPPIAPYLGLEVPASNADMAPSLV